MNWKNAEGLNGRPKFWEEPQQGNPGNDPVLQLSQQRESAAKEEFRGKRAWSWREGLLAAGTANVIPVTGLASSGSHSGNDWDLTEYTDIVWYDDTDHTIVWPYLTFTVDPTALMFNAFYQDKDSTKGTGVPTAHFTLEWVDPASTVLNSVYFYYSDLQYPGSYQMIYVNGVSCVIDPSASGVRMRSDLHTGKCSTTYYDQSIAWNFSFDVYVMET